MPSQSQKWFFRSSELAHGDWDVHIDAANPPAEGWRYTGLRIGTLNKPLTLPADANERIIFLLEGTSAVVEYVVAGGAPASQVLAGRTSVFHGPTDQLYLPINTSATITGTGRIAVGETPATVAKPVQFTPKDKVQVAIRGAGRESRQVHNLGMPDTLDADRMVVCEVIVPAGNWSGSPAHKHDTYIPGIESNLEEIYYFEAAVSKNLPAQESADPVGFFQGRASDEREFELTTEVRSGDVILVPHGWHGPVMAQPGYDLYFMNVMAGPDPDRSWNITDDPTQGWIRKTWNEKDVDPRLPYLNN
jgi:5-deoxy-glucuronate isomerase